MKSNKYCRELIMTICMALFVIGYTGICQLNFPYADGTFSYIIRFLLSMSIPFLGISAMVFFLKQLLPVKMNSLTLLTGLTSVMVILAIIMEVYIMGISIFGNDRIQIGNFRMYKKWFFDVVVVVFFPLLVLMLRQALEQEDSYRNRLSAGMSILFFTFAEVLFFGELGNAWMISMAIMNIITVTGFILNTSAALEARRNERRKVAAEYILVWIFLIIVRGNLYEGNWNERMTSIRLLLKNASAFGTSDFLKSSAQVFYELVYESTNMIHSLLYYTGWVPVLIYLSMMTLFMWGMYQYLGRKINRGKWLYPLYQAAFANLLIRYVGGILYGFGFLPIPVNLPFSGTVGFCLDGISLILLIFAGCESGILNGEVGNLLKDLISGKLLEDVLCDEDFDDDWDEDDWMEDSYEEEVNFMFSKEDFKKAWNYPKDEGALTDEEYYEILNKWNSGI